VSFSLDDLTRQRLVICAGPGGVGKTTTAAAVGLCAARLGRRVLVSTIDPAPRLMDALHMPNLGPDPQPVPSDVAARIGIRAPGSLAAARLDTARAFERLVAAEVPEAERRQRIFANSIYRQITTNLTGAIEHAATLAIHELSQHPDHDLLVLDTPPTSNALDFIEAPRRLAEAIDSPLLRWLTRPRHERRSVLSAASWGGALVMKRLAKIAGSQFLDDVAEFLGDFRTVLAGFLARSRAVDSLLRAPGVAVLLVLAPEHAAVAEALEFLERLRTSGLPPRLLVANRTSPEPGMIDASGVRAALTRAPLAAALPTDTLDRAAAAMGALAHELAGLAAAQNVELGRLTARAPDVPLVRLPLVPDPAGSLSALETSADNLARRLSGAASA
jgi:anion-transporting  ArsA/GET3 family ATPase